MKPAAKPLIRVAGWLLCTILAWLSVSSPHCDLCDGPHFAAFPSSSNHTVNHPAPAEPDDCNGVCACCGFHWPARTPIILSSLPEARATLAERLPSRYDAASSSLFRPPRRIRAA